MHRSLAEIPVALLAGGMATRLGPIAQTLPKALVEVAGAPFIDHQLRLLYRNGIRRIVLCVGHLGQAVQAHCGDGTRYGMRLDYSFDGGILRGTGGAIRQAAPLLGNAPDDLCWIMYGDSYMDIDYRAVLDAFLERAGRDSAVRLPHTSSPLGLMTVLHNGDRWDKSNVVFRDGQLLVYDKQNRSPDMQHIDYGVTLLRRSAIDAIPADRPTDLALLYASLVRNRQMMGFEVTRRFYEIGTPAALEETRAYLLSLAMPKEE